MMDDYKPNSHRYKEEQKKTDAEKKQIQKVVSGNVKVKKKGAGSTLKEVFISEDAANVKSYILMDVLIPAVKKAVSDIVTNGIDMILYGGNGGNKKRSISDRVSYTSFSDARNRSHYHADNRTRSGYSYDDITLDTRGEAELVLDRMGELIDTYGMASVGDLYDLVGVTGQYTDNKYGWTNLQNASVVRVHDGYMLKMPRALPLSQL